MSRSFSAKFSFVFEILRMAVFLAASLLNEAKASGKNTGPCFSITLKTTCKTSGPFAKIFFHPNNLPLSMIFHSPLQLRKAFIPLLVAKL